MAAITVEEFKSKQKEIWALGRFADIAQFTTQAAGHLVRFAGVSAGQRVLDVATGTGVAAITARIKGAMVTGIDLTPSLLAQAEESAAVAGITDIAWREADAEALPFPSSFFDVVLSQFGHMFAPRPEVTVVEMLRVLKPGGVLAFATWPPEQLIGRLFNLGARYVPPPPGIPSPALWGDVSVIQQRLADKTRDLFFERGIMAVPALSPQHSRLFQESKAGPFVRTVEILQKDPQRLSCWRQEVEALVGEYLRDNVVHNEYLLTRAVARGSA
ncbi:MAG: methyltransferase domain-containing protein [Candidatus Omnitrophica bacterium]|nr:methyltransferase domain-containing protein [Candidatus Omnitrophota bacterium]MBI5023800.1 methyltransferase domain-containing protein [Candidatus Omnitrophota bacterium]